MICSISGEIPKEPVVSKKSGLIYEKSLILKYIDETGKEPTTNESLAESDILTIKVDKLVRPRQVSNLSVPGLLSSLQNEWDEVMAETFSLRQALDTTRQELAQALYQHDAACRVIARLMKERDEARAQLAAIPSTSYVITNQEPVQAMETTSSIDTNEVSTPSLLPEYIVTAVTNKCKELSTQRKEKKNQPLGSIDKEWISKYKTTQVLSPHKTNKLGVTSISLYQDRYIASGGNDSVGILSDKQSGSVLHKLVGHEKKINDILIDNKYSNTNIVYTASADKTIKVWKDNNLSTTLATHIDEVTSITQHPLGDYIVGGSLDSTWTLWDINSNKLIKKINNSIDLSLASSKNKKVRFHPDGLILAVGTDLSGILLWDIREQKIEAKIVDPNNPSAVNDISFNENGYLLANSTINGNVNIWDLRKLKLVKTIAVESSPAVVSFNSSGSHLAYGGTADIQLAAVKEYNPLFSAGQITHTKEITGIQWSSDSSFFVTSSIDRTIKIHSI